MSPYPINSQKTNLLPIFIQLQIDICQAKMNLRTYPSVKVTSDHIPL